MEMSREQSQPQPLRIAMMVLSLLGLLIASYLVYIKISPAAPFCGGIGDCEAVNTSIYSTFYGIPIALFGALAYAALLVSLFLEGRAALFSAYGPIFVFGISLMGTLYSAYLTYIELFVIYKICPYCAASAVVMTVIFILSILHLRNFLREPV